MLHDWYSNRISCRIHNNILNPKLYYDNQQSVIIKKRSIQKMVQEGVFLDDIFQELSDFYPVQKFSILHDMISSLDKNDTLFPKYLQLIYSIVKKYHPSQLSIKNCNFYIELLFDDDYCILASKIISEIYEQNMKMQFLLQKFISLILTNVNIYDISSLILVICRNYKNEYDCYLDLLLKDIAQLILHKSLDISSDGIESLFYMTQLNKLGSSLNEIIEDLINKIYICLYSEDPRTISFSLKLLTYFDVNPFLYFNILQQFLNSRIVSIELNVLDCFKHFSYLFIESNQEETIKKILFKAIETEPRSVKYQSLITLLLFDRNNNENIKIIDEFMEFIDNEDTGYDSLNYIYLLLQDLKRSDIKLSSYSELISKLETNITFNDLLYSDDKRIYSIINEIISIIETQKL